MENPEDNQGEGDVHLDGVQNILKKCAICEKMDEDECQIIKDYIVTHSKKLTLHTIIEGVSNLLSEMPQKKKHTSVSSAMSAAKKAQTTNDIMYHIWYCISPVETCVRMTICNSVLMDRLNQAHKPLDTATAVKLLLQTQAAEKKN